jgi:acyl-CoA hydrolase
VTESPAGSRAAAADPATPPTPDEVVEAALTRLGRRIVVGLPLGLGKPNQLVNALYRRAARDPSIDLEIVTALSLDPPTGSSLFERRFLDPFVERHFGADYPRLDYVKALDSGELPANVRIVKFYLRSGASLRNPRAQRHYISSNYTHVARDLVDRGVNLALQLVAAEPGAPSDPRRVSLSCNPDLTLEVAERARRAGRDLMLVAQLHPDLPFMHGDAIVEEAFFDHVLPAGPPHRLFAVPRQPVEVQDYWVGLHAARLVRDGGTLQIGIGALSDALVHALILRHRETTAFQQLFREEGTPGASTSIGGSGPFELGLYGASEMFMDGFMHLYRAGILKREVFEDIETQRLANEGRLEDEAPERVGTGSLMDAAFFLGSRPFYEFLRELDATERPRFRMSSVQRVNQIYGGSEALEIEQRVGARFFNTCMMVTATGAAVSDGLEDHQVVSGVGGQYNFVAMAHAMDDGRSVLMLRSTRTSGGTTRSNLVWEHPHATIPRHLRDIVVTEYGVAHLRGRTDEECIQALLGVCDARFQDELAARAVEAGKLDPRWEIPDRARGNTPAALRGRIEGDGGRERFPRFPFGSDFTPVEERLVEGLGRLRELRHSRRDMAAAVLRGRPGDFPEEMERMGLASPDGWRERMAARLLAGVL